MTFLCNIFFIYVYLTYRFCSSVEHPLGTENFYFFLISCPHLAGVHTGAWYCSNLGVHHANSQFCHKGCLLRMESRSKFCGGSPLDTGLLQFWHLQFSCPSWINKSQHCHSGAFLTPNPLTHIHVHVHTHKHALTHTGRHWHTD